MLFRKGFTLIELLIVIAIILILIAIALPNFLEAQIRAKVARAKGDVRSIGMAQEAYFQDRKIYTNDCGGGNDGCLQLTTPVKYIAKLPIDPFGIHAQGGGNPIHLHGEFLDFYPMGTGTWGPIEWLKARKIYFTTQEPSVRDCYIIYSAGPCDREPGGNTGEFPQPQTEGGWTIYSPTNGTNSYGGILKVGGSLPPAKRYLLIGN